MSSIAKPRADSIAMPRADGDGTGQSANEQLLRLVARANANVAELMRLSDFVPKIFYLEGDDARLYGLILQDYAYFQRADLIEEKLAVNPELADRDEEMKAQYGDILQRFYNLFDSIYRYAQDFLQFIEDIREGVFIQHTMESMLFDPTGKQLMAEAVYLYGVMLTLMDCKIDGAVRERILVAYYRVKGQNEDSNMDAVCKLCERTGFSVEKAKVPANYPERYFARFQLPADVVTMVVSRLRTDDIYGQMESYPDPSHRSTALATQARMLYIILYFTPQILKDDHTVMREIVDKHFPDNWVIAYYMGFTADLQFAWMDYKAARAALGHTLRQDQIRTIAGRHVQSLTPLHARLNDLLTEGMLTEDYVLENRAKLLEDTRQCNVTLRWLMLHRTCVDPKLNKIIAAQLDPEKLLVMLMHTADFEYKLHELLKDLIDNREARWDLCRKDASGRMVELSEYFSGEKPLTRVERSDDLQRWFGNIAEKIRALDIDDATVAGRRMQQIINALEEVEQYHQIDSSLQIKQFLAETREELTVMMRVVNIRKTVLSTLSVVADFSYAWDIINDFMVPMQDRIKLTPHTVKALRATFLKLASVLELPLLRILEAGSDDAESVSQYYSSQLVDYIRKVLQVIPETMFELLQDIAAMQTSRLRELPAKLEKEELGEYAQFEERYSLAKNTHRISIFTEGVLAMDATLIGVIEVQPRQVLEDGIRRELVRKISQALNHFLQFGAAPDGRGGGRSDMGARLQQLRQTLNGYKKSFEYIQDYVNLHGLKIWQEEFSRIVKFNVEQECNKFLQAQVDPKTSVYQDKNIPIPLLPPTTRDARTYMGRLVNELMNVTNPRTTMYLQASNAWFDMSGNELMGIRQLTLLHESVSTFGLTGVDKLLCFMLVNRINMWVKSFRLMIKESQVKMRFAQAISEMQAGDPAGSKLLHETMYSRTWELDTSEGSFIDNILRVGNAQLLRRHIANELNFSCQLNSNLLFCALNTANKSTIADVRAHYARPESTSIPDEDSPLLPELAQFLETAGINHPFTKIYVTTESMDMFAEVMFFLCMSQVEKFYYEPRLASLQCRPSAKVQRVDPVTFITGVATILTQFHSNYVAQFMKLVGEFVRFTYGLPPREKERYPSAETTLLFADTLCRLGNISRSHLDEHVPKHLLDTVTR